MMMRADKRKKLEAKGWKVGSAADFLELSQEESAYLDFKISLSRNLKEIRKKKRWSQTDLANAINSSQSRVAKMEAGDRSVSVDLLVKSLLAIGASYSDLANAISAGGKRTTTAVSQPKKRATSHKTAAA
jgi:DNA-binding XRE family transcriptional regulator